MKKIIIQGSSRSDGNTNKIVNLLINEIDCDIVDLAKLDIGHYDYEYKNQDDDFVPLINKIVEEYDLIIFATPVYWFTMSSFTKVFFDRLSDCIRIHKDTGRKLRGKSMAAICCGSGDTPTPGFFKPFQLSAEYLGMNYFGDTHTWIDDQISTEVRDIVKGFAKKLK